MKSITLSFLTTLNRDTVFPFLSEAAHRNSVCVSSHKLKIKVKLFAVLDNEDINYILMDMIRENILFSYNVFSHVQEEILPSQPFNR